MEIIIKNACLISMSEKRNQIEENIDIKIKDSKIVEIGKSLDIKDADKIIDATNRVVMPGLINTHAHVPMSIFRETLDGYDLQDWLTQKIWPMEDKLTKEDIYYGSKLSFIEMIKTGCTTINDMYSDTDEIIKAALETGIRLETTRTLMNIAGDEDGNKRIKELEEVLNKHRNKYETVTLNAGIHGLYTSKTEYVEKAIRFAKEKELPIHMHFCENDKEVEDIKNIHSKNPIEMLEKFENTKLLLAHSVILTDKEIEKIKQISEEKNIKLSISHCPVSNLKLGCGIANISKMIENEINVSLGTDGQGSGSNLDMFETMKFAALLQKGNMKNPKLMKAYDVLKLATINGAKALGLEEKIGSIEEGKVADIIILDLDTIITKPADDIISNIVYNVKGNNVETTIVNGNILMENRKINIDEEEIFNKCKDIIERIK